jgi:ATP-binding cassette subfamily B protein
MGAQRMLPAIQMAYAGWGALRGDIDSLSDAVGLLEQSLPDTKDLLQLPPIQFNERIELKNIWFRYNEGSEWTISNLSLEIEKGSRIGFVGVTGTGKSTLVDIVMGLLAPTDGAIIVDGAPISECNIRQWRACIAHVPQSIFLSDASIEENIAFGIEAGLIDKRRVRLAAQQAHIHETIASWAEGYRTVVGERGVRLSGGQRQRIGIARALYKRSRVIIFDEATSALDQRTEADVMASIGKISPDITILLISHRLESLRACSTIVELSKGRILSLGPPEPFINKVLSSAQQDPV